MLITQSLLLIAGAAQAYAGVISKRATYAPQFSPTFPNVATPSGVVTSYNSGPYETPSSENMSKIALTGFPETWKTPSTTSAEVKAAYNAINWSQVPAAPVRKTDSGGNIIINNNSGDKYCWWSDTNCVKPKVSYLPADYYTCKNQGDWGLTYDDGPFNLYDTGSKDAAQENDYAEPNLYNFLLQTNQKATLFYIGSNVVTYPAAAKLALNDGHQICVHTYSHPPMTTLTNAEVVSELYWSLKAIKAATGVTSKCWRPPQGDVDDRVRAIAWQMGMRTVLWDRDTNDWDMPAPGGGSLPTATVNGYFQTWINDYNSGEDTAGHVVLEHELNSATVKMTEKWMSKMQATFNVIPALACNGVTQPYWETSFVYPTVNSRPTGTATKTTTTTKTSTATSTPTAACTAGSSGLGKGDGYNGACCKTQADCIDDCISGKCNGPINTKTTTTKTTTTKTATTTTTKSSTTTTNSPTTTTTKTSTTTATPTPASCTAGSSGLGKGDGYNGACCKTQADCIDDCISGKCNGPINTKTTTTKTTTTKTTTTKTATTTTTKSSTTTTNSPTTTTTKTSTTTATPTPASCTAGSSGLGKGDGYNGACCKTQADCIDDCISGKCNGPTNTKTTTTKKPTTTTTKTTTKSSTKTTTKATSTGTCAAGYSGKKNGGGPTGACCTSSDDCQETCRSGICGL